MQADITLQVGAAVDLNVTMRLSSRERVGDGDGPGGDHRKREDRSLYRDLARPDRDAAHDLAQFLDYALLSPGVNEDVRTTGQGIGLKVAGARDKDGALLVDGLWNTDESFTYPKVKYSQDAIAEFQVETIGGAAEFGRSVGGIVSAVTKSGSNAFSGSGYGTSGTRRSTARSSCRPSRGCPRRQFDREQWGGSFGGRIVADRTFFFAAADRSTQTTPFNNSITSGTRRHHRPAGGGRRQHRPVPATTRSRWRS